VILNQLAVVLRAGAAVVVGALAIGKLLALTDSASGAWSPIRLPVFWRRIVIQLLVGVEVVFAMAMLLNPGPRWMLAAVDVVFFTLVSTYGVFALTRGYSCACGQPHTSATSRTALLTRNGALLAAGLSGVLGPSMAELGRHATTFAWPIAALPGACFAVLLCWRTCQRVFLREGSVGVAVQRKRELAVAAMRRASPPLDFESR
jgi:hypothetical protein